MLAMAVGGIEFWVLILGKERLIFKLGEGEFRVTNERDFFL